MSGFEPSDSIRNDLMAEVRHKLARADNRLAVIETVRETARSVCKSDGITFVLREGDMCHYVEQDAIAPCGKASFSP
ncbi:MAG TPA: hypothetical protein VGH23_18760 [Rhizomicrobium sp.]|jgi:hypothetical protein